ncbi:hypothetical protein BS50DRAFT_573989 [Corynespora cassiicola Philippines]|uniref:DUF6594 domain-containing protein n=1 Tax=Corynespora cassiicola Philippines TaxID=1448308 RepID=A0A2T2NP89_CORCC|nr:hypothetical protein BS50DRAFT_573989 [Corynespora cassiicola Philippines]
MPRKQRRNDKAQENTLATSRGGYDSLAAWMTLDTDKEALVFRKFDYLGTRRTLHLQSKILELEYQLRDLDAEVSKNVESKKSLRKHELFEERAKILGSADERRMKLLDAIHIRLTDYHETLLRQSQIADLHKPRSEALKAFRSYFHGSEPGESIVFGKARNMLDNEDDLATLNPPPDVDILSKFIRNHWPSCVRRS